MSFCVSQQKHLNDQFPCYCLPKCIMHFFRADSISSTPRTCSSSLGRVCTKVTSVVSYSATPGTVAHQAPLPMGILQARVLEWVAMLSSRGSSQPRDRMQVSSITADSVLAELPEKPMCPTGTMITMMRILDT